MGGAHRLGQPVAGPAVRALGILFGILGLTTVSIAGLALRDQVAPPDGRAAAPQAGRDAAQPQSGEETAVFAPVPQRVRPVAPDVVAAPPVEPQALQRIAPREPLSPLGRAPTQADLPPRKTLLHRPHAIAAGVFHSMGHTVMLAGLEPPDDKETCVSDGVTWPCGVHARTAFRNWLRGRSLACVVPALPGREVVVSECELGKQDPAAWLASFGWARAAPDGPYAELEAQARAGRRGLFGPAPALPEPPAITAPALPVPDFPELGLPEPETSGG